MCHCNRRLLYELNVCTLHRELAEDAPIINLRKISRVAAASRASVTVITRRVEQAAAREDPKKVAAIRSLLGMGLHRPGSLVTFEGVPEAADLFNVEALAITEIDGETEFGGDDRVLRESIQCCREFIRH